MSIFCTVADAVSTDRLFIVFNVLTITSCYADNSFASNWLWFVLCSWFFRTLGPELHLSKTLPLFTRMKGDHTLWTSIVLKKEKDFALEKERDKQYPVEMMTNADYAYDITLLANTPVLAKSLLHCLEQAARGIGFYMNADNTEFMYFKQDGAISTLSARHLKLVDQFTYLDRNI